MRDSRLDHTEPLVLAFQNGDKNGFDFLFRQYYTALCYFANSILHNEEEAKDIVQDCFVKLWNSRSIKERFETVKSFLYTMVRNSCIDFLRKKKTVRKAESELKKTETDSDFEYFDEVAFAELVRQVSDYIEELPPKVQKVFHLYFTEGKKHKEIANDLNSSPEAIRKQKARALKIIRQRFLLIFSFF
jgi:RNA polymerase sigma-70 factor (family 1)